MKTSWALVVLCTLLIFGVCFAESINEAEKYVEDDVPVPAGAIEISVVEEPLAEELIEEQTFDYVAVPEVLQEKLRVLLGRSTNQQPSEGITTEEPSSKKKNEENVAEQDEPLPQLYQEKLQVVIGPSNQQSFERIMLEEPSSKKKNEEVVAEEDEPLPQLHQEKLQVVIGPSKSQQSSERIMLEVPPLKKTTVELALGDDALALSAAFEKKQQELVSPMEKQPSKESMLVEESLHKPTTQKIVSETEEGLPKLPEIGEKNSSELVQTSIVNEQKNAAAKSDKEQSSENMKAKGPKDEEQNAELIIVEEPTFKIKAEVVVPNDKVSLPQTFEKKQQVLPIPVENQQLTAEMSVEAPLVKKNTEEVAKETLSQLLEIKQKDASGSVVTTIVKEQTDVPVKSDQEQSSEYMKVEETSAKKTAEEPAIEDEILLPQIFQEVQENTAALEENQQSNEDMTVEESAVKIKAEKSPLENVVALPPVLEKILQKLSEPDYPNMIMQQDAAPLRPEMRLPRKVQSFDEQEVHSDNNVDEDYDKPDDLVDERAVWNPTRVQRPNSKKRISSKRHKVNSANRNRIQQRKPNNWNSVRRRNVKKGQMVKNGQLMRNGQWVNNGQWIRKGEWVRRKKSNNKNIRWYNIKNGNVVVRPKNFNKRVNNVKRRGNGNKIGIRTHRRPSNKQERNRIRKQRITAAQFNKNQLSNPEKPINLPPLSSI